MQDDHQISQLLASLKKIEKPIPDCGASDLSATKCYLCYTAEVKSVCKQCGNLICERCQWIDKGWFLEDLLFPHKSELSPKKLRHSVYCRKCFHQTLVFNHIFQTSSLILGIMAIASVLFGYGWILSGAIGIGAIITGFTKRLVSYFLLRRPELLSEFPLFCKMTITVEETISADFSITGNSYLSLSNSCEGLLRINLGLRPGDSEKYKNAFFNKIRSPDKQVELRSGFVVIENPHKIERPEKQLTDKKIKWLKANLFSLDSKAPLQEFEFLGKHHINISKVLQLDPPHNKKMPVQIMPHIFNDGRKLEIKLEITSELKLNYLKRRKDEKQKGVLGKPVLEKLTLQLPATWEIEDSDGSYNSDTGEISWRNKKFDLNSPLSFFVEFHRRRVDTNGNMAEQNDSENDSKHEPENLEGNYKITIEDWTASQLHIARDSNVENQHMIYGPTGMSLYTQVDDLKWITPAVKHQTIIEGTLKWNLAHISAQRVQSVPDVLKLTADRQQGIGNLEKLLVAPSYHVINAIIEELTNQKIFINQIIESPGHVTESGLGGKQMLYWEIRGRYYRENSLQPITLHLIITGEEPRNNQPNCQGVLTFEMSLRSYALINRTGKESYQELEQDYAYYQNLIRVASYRGRQIDYKGRRMMAWQREHQFEEEIKKGFPVKNVAVILPSRREGKDGHLFLQSGDCSRDDVKALQNGWEIHWGDALPKIVAPTIDWIDKWQLLGKVDEGGNGRGE